MPDACYPRARMDATNPGWVAMRDVLSRIAVGPKGSKDLDEEEAYDALNLCLTRQASDVQIGVFLMAQRLKRETEAENHGFLRAIVDASHIVTAAAPTVVSLADPYDGFQRSAHFGPVVAAVLGACGLPAYVHGAEYMPPKFGITSRQVLDHMGLAVGVGGGAESVRSAAVRLAEVGAAFVDLSDFCPRLSALTELRTEIAKRCFLATLEKLATPLRGASSTHVVAGWVHSGYDELLENLLYRMGIASSLLIKATEGHVDPFIHRDTHHRGYVRTNGQLTPTDGIVQPKGYGVQAAKAPEWNDMTVGRQAELWNEALSKKRTVPGLVVRLLAGMVMRHVGHAKTTMSGIGMAHQAIVSGQARRVFMHL